jgi:hypothetical protein
MSEDIAPDEATLLIEATLLGDLPWEAIRWLEAHLTLKFDRGDDGKIDSLRSS